MLAVMGFNIFRYLITVGPVVVLLWLAHDLRVDYLNNKHEKNVAREKLAVSVSCAKAKDITSKVSNDFQKDFTAYRADADRLLGTTGANPVSRAPAPASRNTDSAPGEKLAEGTRRGVIGVVAKGEEYRIRLKACQAFVRAEQEIEYGKGNEEKK